VSYLKRVTLINGFGIICGDEDTDGRVQSTLERQQTKSLTLNNLLAQNGKPLVGNAASVRTEKAKTILEIMNSAANLQDLDSVRPMLDGVLDAQDRDHLINLYHQQREGYTNG
ncbi:MAG: hypothetical protein GWN55_12350, partial [Phycisphaerae bacterium]|nr:hypothetical protein [Phycisphaerae bacterium]NIV02086.1 hypothetical protein [Phycisphaerae bacterium]